MGREGHDRGWDGWMASPTQWTWVWVNSRSWWWTGRPGVLQSMGSQRVRHDWATELNWYLYITYTSYDVLLLVNSWGWFGSYVTKEQPSGITCTAEVISFKCPHWFRKGYGSLFVPNVLFSIIPSWKGKVSLTCWILSVTWDHWWRWPCLSLKQAWECTALTEPW